jgi:hypothetical protein
MGKIEWAESDFNRLIQWTISNWNLGNIIQHSQRHSWKKQFSKLICTPTAEVRASCEAAKIQEWTKQMLAGMWMLTRAGRITHKLEGLHMLLTREKVLWQEYTRTSMASAGIMHDTNKTDAASLSRQLLLNSNWQDSKHRGLAQHSGFFSWQRYIKWIWTFFDKNELFKLH